MYDILQLQIKGFSQRAQGIIFTGLHMLCHYNRVYCCLQISFSHTHSYIAVCICLACWVWFCTPAYIHTSLLVHWSVFLCRPKVRQG